MNKMNYLKSIVIGTTMMTLAGTVNADVYYDYARVKSVKPVYDYVEVGGPVEHCYPTRYKKRRRNGNPTVLGAIVGGAIGNAVGGDSEATLAGVLIGGAIGSTSEHSRYRRGQVCETTYEPIRKVRELQGYKVKYRYNGKRYKTFMKNHPGDTVKIRVKVSPAY